MRRKTVRERRIRSMKPSRADYRAARRYLEEGRERARLDEERRWWQDALRKNSIDLEEDAAPGLTWGVLVDTFLAAVRPEEICPTFMIMGVLVLERYFSSRERRAVAS